jgi:hypothetical protein
VKPRRPNFIDMRGRRVGRWSVLREVPRKRPHNGARWLCKCDCGTLKEMDGTSLREGTSRSCGCLQKHLLTTHGMSRTKEYYTWQGILRRCLNQQSDHYPDYGGRGIKVCARWQGKGGFIRFIMDVGAKPFAGASLDRIDNEGDYEPGNVRWADAKTQANNRRNSKHVEMSDYEEMGIA